MRLYRDSDELTDIQWYFVADPAAQPLPFHTIFASRNWDSEKEYSGNILGEQYGETRKWCNGKKPDWAENTFRGSQDQWEHGCLTSQKPFIWCSDIDIVLDTFQSAGGNIIDETGEADVVVAMTADESFLPACGVRLPDILYLAVEGQGNTTLVNVGTNAWFGTIDVACGEEATTLYFEFGCASPFGWLLQVGCDDADFIFNYPTTVITSPYQLIYEGAASSDGHGFSGCPHDCYLWNITIQATPFPDGSHYERTGEIDVVVECDGHEHTGYVRTSEVDIVVDMMIFEPEVDLIVDMTSDSTNTLNFRGNVNILVGETHSGHIGNHRRGTVDVIVGMSNRRYSGYVRTGEVDIVVGSSGPPVIDRHYTGDFDLLVQQTS